jgi:hypothetical protein
MEVNLLLNLNYYGMMFTLLYVKVIYHLIYKIRDNFYGINLTLFLCYFIMLLIFFSIMKVFNLC